MNKLLLSLIITACSSANTNPAQALEVDPDIVYEGHFGCLSPATAGKLIMGTINDNCAQYGKKAVPMMDSLRKYFCPKNAGGGEVEFVLSYRCKGDLDAS